MAIEGGEAVLYNYDEIDTFNRFENPCEIFIGTVIVAHVSQSMRNVPEK